MRELKTMRWYAILVGACFAFHAADAGSSDIEEGLNNCCEEGSQWGTSRSGCDGLPLPQLPATQSCRIAQEICCRSALRQRLCDAGKAAARGGRPCHDDQSECVGDTYRDCCDGCRLGLAAVKEGAPCRPQTFSLGLPWDDAFYQCCSGRDDLPDDTSATGHDNDVPAGPGDRGHDVPTCPSGQELHNDGRTCVPVKTNNGGAHERPCDRNNPCEQICHVVNSSPVCKCHEGYRLEDDLISCADIDECSDGMDDCDESREQCMNTPGSFKCIPNADSVALPDVGGDVPQCDAGFKYNTAIKDCIDVDECSEGLDDCELDTQSCLNTHGGYQCLSKESKECPGGYVWKDEACVDVDECSEGLSACEAEHKEECKNTVGGYVCDPICAQGHRYNTLYDKCLDIDECLQGSHTCGSVALCVNTEGGFQCKLRGATHATGRVAQCPRGFRYSRHTRQCQDVDECRENTHNCRFSTQSCVNTEGGFTCRDRNPCPAGYRMDRNTRSCIDTDECAEDRYVCPQRETQCVNTPGSYRCVKKSRHHSCQEGFRYDPRVKGCQDVNECTEGLSNCAEGEACVNGVGSFSCVPVSNSGCTPGYRRNTDTGRCEDINECEEYVHSCKGHLQCVNTRGSYLCERRPDASPAGPSSSASKGLRPDDPTCGAGYRTDPLTRDCRDIDECQEDKPCGTNEVCRNTYGGFECTCNHGYKRDQASGTCKDVNECQYGGHNCQIGFRCDNTPGSFTCVRISGCGTGYTVNAATGQCEDDDECALGIHNCGPNFECQNTEGSFRCVRSTCPVGSRRLDDGSCQATNCPPGHTSDSFGNCADINECAHNRSLCGRYHRCINTVGSYQCESLLSCTPGYEPNSQGNQCLDIDECATNTHDCRVNQTCSNMPGSYVCECPIGFRMNSFRDCEDIDECTRFAGRVCSVNSECINTPGSYTCHCKPGFKRGYDERTCIDVNECEAESHACQHSCINTWGSYQCICKKGFRLAEDQRMCVDVDECEMWKGRGSLCIGTCVNEPGSYSCTCPEGYVLNNDKRTCQDIDECERGDICRGENEVCLNTRGGYRCNKLDCPPGYFRDADHKTRCKREKRDCAPEDQECRKEPLSLSFNYFTLPHNMKIPPSGHQDFFTMRGPRFSFSTVHFELELVEARASSRAHGVEVATREHFFLRNTGVNEAMVSIVRPLQGPQDIQLELRTSIYHNGLYSGSALAKIFIYVTEHEF
ncbi:fibulin-1-like isoform X1 [Dermacentor silvarum]|uniref:fibulin-1-like isoform X1 n=1 Tax=Dermacentor silvarum TaxID=543639 RepID=UPI001898990A|nr:fibulin-1-like isoform X1 [Dermacentor silvarum]